MGNQRVENAAAVETEGLYVYCIVPGSQEVNLGPVGLDRCEVHIVPGSGISAVVHECPAQPYQSEDRSVVEKWVLAHYQVVEAAWERFGNVLPMSFDMIVKGDEDASACENLIKWLQEKQATFTRQLERFRGKAEYGVQISWDPKVIAADVLKSDPDLEALKREIEAKPKGLAYMERARLEKAIKEQMEARAGKYYQSFCDRIRACVQDIRVERPKKTEDGTQMLLNVSCLVEKGDHGQLGQVLDHVTEMPGLGVRFTGPWPPYSFVGAG